MKNYPTHNWDRTAEEKERTAEASGEGGKISSERGEEREMGKYNTGSGRKGRRDCVMKETGEKGRRAYWPILQPSQHVVSAGGTA